MQAWIIWNQRKCVVHGGNLKDPNYLNKQAEEYLEEFKQAQAHLKVNRIKQTNYEVWQPPPPSAYKLILTL